MSGPVPPQPKPRFFASPAAFGRWLAANHQAKTELLVGYWKVGTGKPSMTWAQSVEQALRYGWIDGMRRSLGEESYCIRFTPRKPRSHWSNVNVRMAKALLADGRMAPAGRAAFEARDRKAAGRAHYEQRQVTMPVAMARALKADRQAWADFQGRPAGYRKAVTWWIVSAKRDETRARRMQQLVESSKAGEFVRGWVWSSAAKRARNRKSGDAGAVRRPAPSGKSA
jgi:uncharacterized protein YdeI (YjbR/CyaY-like superfamily)